MTSRYATERSKLFDRIADTLGSLRPPRTPRLTRSNGIHPSIWTHKGLENTFRQNKLSLIESATSRRFHAAGAPASTDPFQRVPLVWHFIAQLSLYPIIVGSILHISSRKSLICRRLHSLG